MTKLQIGDIRLDAPFVLAPIAGYTDPPFRRVCREHRCPLTHTEMVSAQGFVRNNRESRRLLSLSEDDRPTSVQVFGREPEHVAAAARFACEKGAVLVDVNAGCPARKVLKSGGGAALLKDPSLLGRIVEAVVRAVRVPVTVKTRLGWSDGEETFLEIGRIAVEAGACAVALHARSVAQGFSGHADWSKIRVLVERLSVPVIGNGDVRSPEDAFRMQDETGCAGVMIGRGAIGNPWIFSRLASVAAGEEDPGPPALPELCETAIRHLREARKHYGDHAVAPMKKHLVRYVRGLPKGSEIRMRICEAKSVEEEEKILAGLARE